MRSRKLTCVSITLIVVLLCQNVHSQLQVGFYRNSCDYAESIVKDEVRNSFIKDQGVAAGLVRLHFHDCFVRVSKRAKSLILLALISWFHIFRFVISNLIIRHYIISMMCMFIFNL